MGKMVADTRAAVDAVTALTKADSSRIYIVGLGLGAQVGLITAALDDRDSTYRKSVSDGWKYRLGKYFSGNPRTGGDLCRKLSEQGF
jgi:dipeptidyl aminopeptidase/acylaminoacyl peptidase